VEPGRVLVGETVDVTPLVVESLEGLVVLEIGAIDDPGALGRVVADSEPSRVVVVVVIGDVVLAVVLAVVPDVVIVIVGAVVVEPGADVGALVSLGGTGGVAVLAGSAVWAATR
jgi:hypothetical protein